MKRILYKVLNKNLTSPFQGFEYKVGKTYHEPNIDLSDNDCSLGFYATEIEGLLYSHDRHKVVYECEVWGKHRGFDQFKQRFEYIRLTRKVSVGEIKAKAKVLEPDLGYKLREVLFPANPLTGKAKIPTLGDIELLKRWVAIDGASLVVDMSDYIRGSLLRSKWGYVCGLISGRIENLVARIVAYSLRNQNGWLLAGNYEPFLYESTINFVFAYISSFFPGIMKWESFDHKPGENPLQPAIDLWKRGFFASCDGESWYLHSGKEGTIVHKLM